MAETLMFDYHRQHGLGVLDCIGLFCTCFNPRGCFMFTTLHVLRNFQLSICIVDQKFALLEFSIPMVLA